MRRHGDGVAQVFLTGRLAAALGTALRETGYRRWSSRFIVCKCYRLGLLGNKSKSVVLHRSSDDQPIYATSEFDIHVGGAPQRKACRNAESPISLPDVSMLLAKLGYFMLYQRLHCNFKWVFGSMSLKKKDSLRLRRDWANHLTIRTTFVWPDLWTPLILSLIQSIDRAIAHQFNEFPRMWYLHK